MNHHLKRQHHEQARKRRRHQVQEYFRLQSRRKPSSLPRWLLAIGLTVIFLFIAAVTLR